MLQGVFFNVSTSVTLPVETRPAHLDKKKRDRERNVLTAAADRVFLYFFKMATNIYEEPKWTLDVRHSKGEREDGGEREERLVDIYERVDTFTHRGDNLTHDGGAVRSTSF